MGWLPRRAARRGALALGFALLALVGCGGGEAESAAGADPRLTITRATLSGRLDLGGSPTDPTLVAVRTSAGTAVPAAGGAFAVDGLAGGPQLAMALSPAGRPMLLGWLGDGHTDLSPRSTAEVLLFFRLGLHLLPSEAMVRAVELLAEMEELESVADAITSAIGADPDGLADGDEAVSAALEAVATLVLEYPQPEAGESAGRDLAVDAGEKSGITPLVPAGINDLQVMNTRRRRAYAWIDRVSYVPAAGGDAVASPARVTELDVTPVKGTSTLLGFAQDILNGFVGSGWTYDPFYSEKIRLPVQPGEARSTLYRLTVVGPGWGAGDVEELTEEQNRKRQSVIQRAFVCDFFLPIIVNLAIPLKGEAIDDYLAWTNGSGTVQDFVGILTSNVPGIWDKAYAGDFDGALYDAYQALQTSNTFRLLVLQKVADVFLPDLKDANKFADLAQSFVNVLTLGDMILTGFDSILQAVDFAQSNTADIWGITATPPDVRIDPAEAKLAFLDNVLLTAIVPAAQGDAPSGDAPVFEYRWSNTGVCGSLTTTGHDGEQSFTTTEEFVYYFADDDTPGEDTVTVAVYEIDGNQRNEVGTATAHIVVDETKVTLEPTGAVLGYEETQTLTAGVAPAQGGTVVYRWHNTGTVGSLGVANDTDSAVAAPVYTAGDELDGQDTITVEAILIEGATRTSLGSDRATILVQEEGVEVSVAPSPLSLAAGAQGTLAATLSPEPPAGKTVYYRWTNTATVGGLTGGDLLDGTSASVTYTAATGVTGTDTVTCQAYLMEGGEKVVLGQAAAAVQVGLTQYTLQFSSGIDDNLLSPGSQESFIVFVKPSLPVGTEVEFRFSGGGGVGSVAPGSHVVTGYSYDSWAKASVSDEAHFSAAWPQAPGATGDLRCEMWLGGGASRALQLRATVTCDVHAPGDYSYYTTLSFHEKKEPKSDYWFGWYESAPVAPSPGPAGVQSQMVVLRNATRGSYAGSGWTQYIAPTEQNEGKLQGEYLVGSEYLNVGWDPISAASSAAIAELRNSMRQAGDGMEGCLIYSLEKMHAFRARRAER